MATTQTTPSAETILATVGVPLNLQVTFGPGGNARLKSETSALLRLDGVSADNSAPVRTALSITLMPLKAGVTDVIFLVDPLGTTPILEQKVFQIQIAPPQQ